MPTARSLVRMMVRGVYIDPGQLAERRQENRRALAEAATRPPFETLPRCHR